MRKIFLILLCMMFIMPVFAGGSSESGSELVVSTWGLSEDDLWAEVYEPFETENDATVILDVGNGQERFTKLQNDPRSTVDVIELAQLNAAQAKAAGILDPIKPEEIDDFENLIPAAQEIIASGSGASYTLNSIGIVYNRENAGIEINEWTDLWDPALKGKIAIPDITTTFGPAFVIMASDAYGVDATTDGGETAFKALSDLKPNVLRTYAKSSDVANLFQNGEVAVAVVGDFGLPIIQSADPDVEYVVPESGTYANFNVINITKNADDRDLAVKYINYRLNKDTQTRTAEVLNEAPTNGFVVLTPEIAANKTVGDIAARAKMVDFNFVNSVLESWVDQFNRIMNVR